MDSKDALANTYQAYLVHLVALRQSIEDGVHPIEHGHHFHGAEPRADLGEGDDIGEQDGYAVEHLQTVEFR